MQYTHTVEDCLCGLRYKVKLKCVSSSSILNSTQNSIQKSRFHHRIKMTFSFTILTFFNLQFKIVRIVSYKLRIAGHNAFLAILIFKSHNSKNISQNSEVTKSLNSVIKAQLPFSFFLSRCGNKCP